MITYTRLPASSKPHAEPALSNHFMRAGSYAPRPKASSLPEKALVTWEEEGGSLAGPSSA